MNPRIAALREAARQRRQLTLGIFFATAFTLLVGHTFFLSDVPLFKYQEKKTAYFPAAYGLKEGSTVRASGLDVGRVKRIRLDLSRPPEQRIAVELVLDVPLGSLAGARISIAETTLMGNRHVNIEVDAGEEPRDDRLLLGDIQENPIATLSDVALVFTENRVATASIIRNFKILAKELGRGDNVLNQFRGQDATGRVELARAVKNVTSAVDHARAGGGVLGAFFSDGELNQRLVSTIEHLRALSDEVGAGNSLFDRLGNSEKLRRELQLALESFQGIGRRIDNGEGLLGRFLSDPALAQDLAIIQENLVTFQDEMVALFKHTRDGNGSLGSLLRDETFLEQVVKSLKLLVGGLEDDREDIPTFGLSTLLGGG